MSKPDELPSLSDIQNMRLEGTFEATLAQTDTNTLKEWAIHLAFADLGDIRYMDVDQDPDIMYRIEKEVLNETTGEDHTRDLLIFKDLDAAYQAAKAVMEELENAQEIEAESTIIRKLN